MGRVRLTRRPPSADGGSPCLHCGAARVDGIRTCGVLCVRGLDPRLADYIGVMPWTAAGVMPWLFA